MSQPMISIEGLTKDYGTTHALQGLNFQVPRGQIVGFLGPNGAGKSTTMKILAGYATPTAGTARIAGMDVTVDSIATRRLLGYLPENNPLYEEMIVVDFLDFVAQVRGIPAAERRARMKNTAERCGLVSVIGKKIGELRNLIKELGAAKTVILCTHILSEVQTTCNRVLIINEGKLVADDTPEHLTTGQGGTVQVVLASRFGGTLQPTEVRSLLERIPGVSAVESGQAEGPGTLGFVLRYADEDPRRGLFEAAVKNNLLILEVRRRHVSLEETFRKLTAGEPQRKEPPAAAA